MRQERRSYSLLTPLHSLLFTHSSSLTPLHSLLFTHSSYLHSLLVPSLTPILGRLKPHRRLHRLLPPGVQRLALIFLHRRLELSGHRPALGNIVTVFPEAHGKPCKIRSTLCRRFLHLGAQQGHVENIGLELRHEIIGDRATIRTQLFQLDARVALHRFEHIARLICHRLQRGTNELLLRRATRQAEYRTAHIAAPVRRTQADEGRHEIHAIVVACALGILLRVAGLAQHAQAIAQPLDYRAGDEDAAFERVLDLAIDAPCNRREQTVLGTNRLVAGVHQHEATRAIGVLGQARLETRLPEQRCLLIAGDAGNGYLTTEEMLRLDVAIDFARRFHLGQHRPRHVEYLEQLVVPLALVDVVHQGARGVGVVGDMHLAAGEVPDQPGVDGAEQQLALLRTLACALDLVEYPLHLGTGEISVDQQTSLVAKQLVVTVGLDLLADIGGLA